MTGDGTPDIVGVDGRGVTYWPYLGFGTFGEPVAHGLAARRCPSMSTSSRVFVVDLDGDGCADVALPRRPANAVRWWPNCAGRTSSRRADHPAPAGRGDAATVRVADVLGTGVAGAVLDRRGGARAARRSWYALDLTRAAVRSACSRRSTTASAGAPKSRTRRPRAERRRDRAAGPAVAATVPMVLPLVQSTTGVDAATGRTDGSRFEYHDGRFDDVRREFCGFGEVTQTDPGDTHVPTLVTTRRFHVGLRRRRLRTGERA